MRDQVKVMVGGAPGTEDFATAIGADKYGRDAGAAANAATELVAAQAGGTSLGELSNRP